MTAPLGEGRTIQFICGATMILLAVIVFHRARVAEERREIVPSRSTWMSPTQAYVASALCFGGGLVIIGSGIASRRREKEGRNDAAI